MPNRILRDWTTSEAVDRLSLGAEVFYIRLIMKADDYGNYTANPKLLKAALFPLRDVTPNQVAKWVEECADAQIIVLYHVDGKEYINIPKFGQRLRQMRSTCPQPADNPLTSGGQLTVNGRPETKRNEEEVETETEGAARLWPTFEDFWEKYQKKVDRHKCEKKWGKVAQPDREKIMEHLERYIRSTPDVKFRRDPATYLNNRSWENEIITNGTAKITRDDRNRYFETKYGTAGTAKN